MSEDEDEGLNEQDPKSVVASAVAVLENVLYLYRQHVVYTSDNADSRLDAATRENMNKSRKVRQSLPRLKCNSAILNEDTLLREAHTRELFVAALLHQLSFALRALRNVGKMSVSYDKLIARVIDAESVADMESHMTELCHMV